MKVTNIKIATLGAATQDVYLLGSVLKAKRDVRTQDFVEQFPLGAKLELDGVVFDVGGGATNAAVTFARHGFETVFLGKIGDDPAGKHILSALEAENVNTAMVKCDIEGVSGYSTLLLAPRGERTVLVYRGVSQELRPRDFNYFAKLKSDWLYITSLSGNFALLEAALSYGKTHGMKVAINPGSTELAQADRLKKILPEFDVVSLNKQEAALLVGDAPARELAARISQLSGVAVVTDGPKGAYASNGQEIYKAGVYKDVSVLDRTGAGDAFTSGFVAKVATGASIPEALTFASANSTSVVQHIGAKKGILKRSAKIKKMPIKTLKRTKKETVHA